MYLVRYDYAICICDSFRLVTRTTIGVFTTVYVLVLHVILLMHTSRRTYRGADESTRFSSTCTKFLVCICIHYSCSMHCIWWCLTMNLENYIRHTPYVASTILTRKDQSACGDENSDYVTMLRSAKCMCIHVTIFRRAGAQQPNVSSCAQ